MNPFSCGLPRAFWKSAPRVKWKMCTVILFVCQVSLIPEGLYLPRPAFFQTTAHKAEIHGADPIKSLLFYLFTTQIFT